MKKNDQYLKVSSKRLGSLLSELGISQQELADKSGVLKSSISQYLSERATPPNINAGKMAKVLSVDPLWLMGFDVPMKKENSDSGTKFDNIFPIQVHKYPLLGEVACGEPIFMSEERENYVMSGTDVKADFCLIAKGDSMINARIMDGDIVFIRKQPTVENGEIAAVVVNNDNEATLKRFYYYRERATLILKPENPEYEDLIFQNEELNEVQVLGKAIAFQSDVK